MGDTVVVVSADEEVVGRIRRLGSELGIGAVKWVSDPLALRDVSPITDVRGLVLDLSSPPARHEQARRIALSSTQVRTQHQADLAWCLSVLLAAARGYSNVPLAIVGNWDDLDSVLRAGGLDAMAWIPPTASETFWRAMLRRLVSAETSAPLIHATATPPESAETDTAGVVRVGPDVMLDLHACILLRGQDVVPLTARELAVLELLLAAPARFHRPRDLALRLTPAGGWEVDEHSIEQTIYQLRRKLGESARYPRLLLCKRGIGYGLFPGNGGDTAET